MINNNNSISYTKYLTHYYCSYCGRWILHEDAIINETKFNGEKLQFPVPICPYGCSKSPLRKKALLPKLKEKLREKQKRLNK